MLSDAKSPKEYLQQMPDDWRAETLKDIRALILKTDADLKERINYKMLAYGIDVEIFCHLNIQANYVSLYFGDIQKVDPDNELLDGLSQGKGCIRFTKSKKVAATRIDKFIAKANKMWRDGHDIGC
jgi:uncharacterized protein YdhG (YjbR/CyaY superfamily)